MKQYFTGFFTAACLTVSVFMFIGAESKNLGDIEVNSIKVVDKNGKITVHLGINVIGGGWLGTYNADGEETILLRD